MINVVDIRKIILKTKLQKVSIVRKPLVVYSMVCINIHVHLKL